VDFVGVKHIEENPMPDLKTVVVATVQGTELSLHDLLHTLKLQGQLNSLIAGAVVEKVIASAALKEGLRVSDEELQHAADAFRLRRGLNKAADTQRWLAQNRLALADLEEGLQRDLIRQKLADKVTRGQVEKAFAENRAQFDRARLRHIVVEKEGVAQELLSRLQEEGADFGDLAREHSIDARTRQRGGDLGIVSRQAMPPAINAAVYGAKTGDVVGPLKTDAGYVLIKVEEILLGQLDAATTTAIGQNLFRDWIAQQVQNGNVEMKLQI
jgi:parvulin-like peptidyl-prolyl isomerase